MKLAGVTLIANGIDLNYPFEICIKNLLDCCDQVYVATDINNKDKTLDKLEEICSHYGRITILSSEWNWGITNGIDLATRANQCLNAALKDQYDYVLYLQADEIVNPREINLLKHTARHTWLNIALERTYFWQDLNHVNLDWTLPIPRFCYLDETLKVIGDGMSMRVNQHIPLIQIDPMIARIYHYSRVGKSGDIGKRLNNLDLLFHSPEEFQPLKDYIFGQNNNYERGCPEARIEQVQLKHPLGVLEFYKGYR